jgi:hypothetical protein
MPTKNLAGGITGASKKGLSTPEENRAIEWLATRLRSDDWKQVFS